MLLVEAFAKVGHPTSYIVHQWFLWPAESVFLLNINGCNFWLLKISQMLLMGSEQN